MKFAWRIALIAVSAALFASCATTRHAAPSSGDCTLEAAAARGTKDGASGRKLRTAYLQGCPAEQRAEALRAYREFYAASRPKHKAAVKEAPVETESEEEEEAEAAPAPELNAVPASLSTDLSAGRVPSNLSWVCEIEADTRVFTGVGITHDEALSSAKSTCGAHFQASYCTKADCKQNL